MTNDDVEIKEMSSEELEAFDKAKRREALVDKAKTFLNKTGSVAASAGKGALKLGAAAGTGMRNLADKGVKAYKEYNAPENQLKRAELAATKAEYQAKIRAANAKARQYQPQQSSPFDMFSNGSGSNNNNAWGSGGNSFFNDQAMGKKKSYNPMDIMSGSGNMGSFSSGLDNFLGNSSRPRRVVRPIKRRKQKVKIIYRTKPKRHRRFKLVRRYY